MKRCLCILAAMALCISVATESMADYVNFGGVRARVEIKRYNAPQLAEDLLTWLYQVSGWDMWKHALAVKEANGDYVWRIRFRVVDNATDTTTTLADISSASVSHGGSEYLLALDARQGIWKYDKLFDTDTELKTDFVGDALFRVTVSGVEYTQIVSVPSWTEVDMPDFTAARGQADGTVVVSVNDPVVRGYTAGAWSSDNPYDLVDEQSFNIATQPYSNTIQLTDTLREGGLDPAQTYAYEVEAVNDDLSNPAQGMSYRTILFGILQEGEDYLDPDAPGPDEPNTGTGDSSTDTDSGGSGGGCLMNPAAGLTLDMLLPLLAACGLLVRRFRR